MATQEEKKSEAFAEEAKPRYLRVTHGNPCTCQQELGDEGVVFVGPNCRMEEV